MELERSYSDMAVWGTDPFGYCCTELPTRAFNLLRVSSRGATVLAIGHFLQAGLERDQRVALVSFDHPGHLLAGFREAGFYFDRALLAEQLIYLYYKPVFSLSLNLSTNYRQLYSEIARLSNGQVSRIAFLNAEVLFNLESHLLAVSSADKLMAAFSSEHCSVLGIYHGFDTPAHHLLHQVSKASMSSYLEIREMIAGKDLVHELVIHNAPDYQNRNGIHPGHRGSPAFVYRGLESRRHD